MDQISRYVWPIRLAFLGTIVLLYFYSWVVAMLMAVIGVPISFHYLILSSRLNAKRAGLDHGKSPIQDLALVFAAAPAIWLALIVCAGDSGQELLLAMVGIWLWFQCAYLAPIIWLGRRRVLPGPGDARKIGYFLIPWALMALFMMFGGRRPAWRDAFAEPQARAGWGLVALAAILSLYLVLRLRAHLNDFPNALFVRPAPGPDSRYRFPIFSLWAFVFLPLIWGLVFVSLCVHWQVYLSGTDPEASWLATRSLALHLALVEFSALTIAFAFPVGTLLVWYALKFRIGSSPEPSAWLGLFLPWGLLLLAIGVDPGGWFAWLF